MSLTDLKAEIDAAITNKTSPGSVTPTNVGTELKNVAQFAQDLADYSKDNGYPVKFDDGSYGTMKITGNYEDGSATITITKP